MELAGADLGAVVFFGSIPVVRTEPEVRHAKTGAGVPFLIVAL
jgi:hypothetical protein